MAVATAEPYRAGSAKQLFVDDRLIAESRGIRLALNPPVKMPERCLWAERPWEDFYAGGWNTVLEDGGVYKLWYEASTLLDGRHSQSVCYAASHDGIRWEKPTLGLVEFRGSKENNIVLFDIAGTVFVDPRAPESERYRFAGRADWARPIYSRTTPEVGIWIFGSPDGLRWKPLREGPVIRDRGNFDTQNQVFWDARLGKYVAYVRLNRPLRKVGRAESLDLLHWTTPEVVFSYDALDPVESDHYNPCVVPYPGAPDVYLMFPSAFYHYPGRPMDGYLDIQLATSRDGIRWERRFRTPYVRLGLEGSDDGGSIYMTVGMLRRGDEIWMYYTGFDYTHGAYDLARTRKKGVVRRLVQRLDGFISVDAGGGGGELTTVPLLFDGNTLELNVDTGALGSARVAVLDASGREVAGFGAADCDPIRGNFTRRAVTWKRDAALAALAQPVRLRFVLERAKLYAFQFRVR
ncbi:MAG: hypothetical protein DMG07_11640 [Acidobacteria bacterium]|nr:MAG: hypothetical protein DMG07_11640 [Acidobacteriota bacterium]